MEGDKYFSSLLYSICEGNMSDGKKETASITTFKKWSFANDFVIETEDGKLLSA